jgi:hypothetical protein
MKVKTGEVAKHTKMGWITREKNLFIFHSNTCILELGRK